MPRTGAKRLVLWSRPIHQWLMEANNLILRVFLKIWHNITMVKIQFSTRESSDRGYSVGVLKKVDGSIFTEDEIFQSVGKAVGTFIMRIKSLSFKPVDTRRREEIPDSNRVNVQRGEVKKAVVSLIEGGIGEAEITILMPEYVVSDTRLSGFIDEFNQSI